MLINRPPAAEPLPAANSLDLSARAGAAPFAVFAAPGRRPAPAPYRREYAAVKHGEPLNPLFDPAHPPRRSARARLAL